VLQLKVQLRWVCEGSLSFQELIYLGIGKQKHYVPLFLSVIGL